MLILACLMGFDAFSHAADAGPYAFTAISVPGAVATFALGINDADQIVGYSYSTTRGGVEQGHGFLYEDGKFAVVEVPNSAETFADGINNSGQIVGFYRPLGSGSYSGFLDTAGSFTKLPGVAYGINDSGQMVVPSGLRDVAGTDAPVNVPDAQGNTFSQGINDLGQVVGAFTDAHGNHGFLKTGESFKTIGVPGAAANTGANGINDLGQIVGTYSGPQGINGFLDTDGRFITVDVPGASDTYAQGISDTGQIVGVSVAAGADYGFLATPVPEPGSFAVLAAAGIGVGCARRPQRCLLGMLSSLRRRCR
jgi:probable HAF family extracellular repeat protein